jgi:hypothetical protein
MILPIKVSIYSDMCDSQGTPRVTPVCAPPCLPYPTNYMPPHNAVNAFFSFLHPSHLQTDQIYSGIKPPLTPNIFAPTPAVKPSTCLAYCSTCLEFRRISSRPGSAGNLNKLFHSSSGSGVCFAATLAAFSAFRFCCHAVIFACSRASERW